MDLSAYKAISIGGVALKELKINGVLAWKSGPTNQVPLSINADGSIYNGTGYKTGYRVRSGGAEGTSNGSCTGFIRVAAGDVVRITGFDFSANQSANAINASDAAFTNLGQLTPSYASAGYGIFAGEYLSYSWSSVVEESTGVWKWIVPPAASGVAYIRLSGYEVTGENMVLTINEEIA